MSKIRWSLVLVLVLVLTSAPTLFAADKGAQTLAPVVGLDSPNVIPGRYIVVLKADSSERAVQSAITNSVKALGGQLYYTYLAALKGFAATLPARAVEALQKNPDVAYIEADQKIGMLTTQLNPPWGLDRIDQRNLPLNAAYTYIASGGGVSAYVIDTGINVALAEFGGRAFGAFTAINDGNGTNDCNGHGTGIAAIIGAKTYGVAKNVRLYAVRVLDCNGTGTTAGVIAGVNWVTANHNTPAVANMSLGGAVSTSLDTAVNNSITSGVTYAISAGNNNDNACNYSPGRVAAALTVGATTPTDERAAWSNWGPCLDLFAPGVNIPTITHTGAPILMNGTSAAAPHVAGVVALYLQTHPAAPPAVVNADVVNHATVGVVINPGLGSPNKLLYMGGW